MHSAILTIMMITAATGGLNDWRDFMRPSITPHHQINFRFSSQRQDRKNRRRAHAAGKRNAFK